MPKTRRRAREKARLLLLSGEEGSNAAVARQVIKRFNVDRCVIDALPEPHATRDFARRHAGRVYLNYFNPHQRGKFAWKPEERLVQENRTEALDFSRQMIRDGRVLLPRPQPVVEEFARHLAADAKQLVEDEKTGAQEYRYIRTGPDHYGLAFTYDCIASSRVFDPRHAKYYGWVL